uniref:Major facilitator superfamily (MFS) profile domain-containing protein n=1 Tax=Clastoptera arizonana TaxID=38151 RepID=A0A1B6CTG1_9HEMI
MGNGVARQYVAATTAALSVFIAGCWLGWPSPAVKMIMNKEAHITIEQDQIAWIVSLMDFGNVLSPIPSGYMADYFGRKITLISTAFLYIVTWVLAIFATTAPYLYAARIGAGIGKGFAFTVVPMYLGELAGVKVRGAISTIFTGLLYSGILFEYCVGPFVSYNVLNIISGIIPIVFFVTFIWMPESPYFLLMKGQQKKARESLAWFRGANVADVKTNEELEEMSRIVKKEMEEKGSFKDLMATPGNRKAMAIVMLLSSFQRLGGISPMLAYTVITLPSTGGYFKPDFYMIIFGIALVVGNFGGIPLIDRVGRKPLLMISCLGCATLTGISCVFYWIQESNDVSSYNWIPYVCFASYGITYSIGIGVIPSTFVAELFPTNVKSFASAIAAIFFAVASFAINRMYLAVQSDLGVFYNFGLFTFSSLVSAVFTYFVVFETKGKTFAEIQKKLNEGRNQREENIALNT